MSKQETKQPVVKVTLELDPKVHRELGRIARSEGRSKRKEAARAVTDYVASRRQPSTT